MIIARLKDWLAHPLTNGLSIDDPNTTLIRRKIIREKVFLRKIYEEWYQQIIKALPLVDNNRDLSILEIGSGAGFLKEYIPNLITSEVFSLEGIDQVIDAHCLPFLDGELDAIVMTDVFHHIPDVRKFLDEASRSLRPGGRLVMIEPWKTKWSHWVYQVFHHEPFDPDVKEWELNCSGGPLSLANGALPWIVFQRDVDQFTEIFPKLKIRKIVPQMPILYLLSGGVSLRSLVPGFLYPFMRAIENTNIGTHAGMFARIEVERIF